MKKIFLLFSFLYFNQIFSQSDSWRYIGATVKNEKYYTKTIENNSFYTTCWVKAIAPSKSATKGKSKGRSGYYTIEKWTIYCNNNTFSVSSSVSYNMNGTVREDNSMYTQPEQTPLPESIAEGVVNTMCILNPYHKFNLP